MTPRPGHNRGPALDPAADCALHAHQLRQEIAALHVAAEYEAAVLLHAFEQKHGPWLFSPSRLARCPRDRRWHERTRAGYLAAALDKRRPQIERARRKLRRLTGRDAP